MTITISVTTAATATVFLFNWPLAKVAQGFTGMVMRYVRMTVSDEEVHGLWATSKKKTRTVAEDAAADGGGSDDDDDWWWWWQWDLSLYWISPFDRAIIVFLKPKRRYKRDRGRPKRTWKEVVQAHKDEQGLATSCSSSRDVSWKRDVK